jgi:hypothetical protein
MDGMLINHCGKALNVQGNIDKGARIVLMPPKGSENQLF